MIRNTSRSADRIPRHEACLRRLERASLQAATAAFVAASNVTNRRLATSSGGEAIRYAAPPPKAA